MLKESLVYLRRPGGGEAFVGCGAYIEQNLIVTCRHVWRDADEQAEAVFPHLKREGVTATSALELVDACNSAVGDDPDVVLLRPTDPPDGLTPLQIARGAAYETGEACALARLPTRRTDREIPGEIGNHIDQRGRRAFSQDNATGYWLEKGSSGSPIFVGTGQQLAGLVSMAELGDEPQNAPVREAYVVPGTIIWPFVRAVAQREFDARQHAIQQALLDEKEAAGARELVFEIARRSGGDAAATFEQAVADARAAYEEGRKAIEAGERGANLGALVNDLLAKIAERTRAGDFVGGAAEADRAFAEWERVESERRAEAVAAGVRILSEGARQDMLRRDFRAAAQRIARIVELEKTNASARFAALRGKQNEFYVDGRDKGVNASLEVAIELTRLELELARDADERGAAGNDLGVALVALGERESGTARLEEAIVAYRAALEERTRERVPLRWATTWNNLGNALWRLGERESSAVWLDEAAAAYRAALEVFTREQVPLYWAATQNNLGLALWRLGERESSAAWLEEAAAAYRAALEVFTREQVPLYWAATQNNLGNALEALGERDSGTTRLEDAVASYRAALWERTRDRVPLDWAQTQSNLGNALVALGKRESGTARLAEAVQAYRAALEELTRERAPIDWTASVGGYGLAMMIIAERANDGAAAESAMRQIEAALEAALTGGNNRLAAKFQAHLSDAQAIRNRLNPR